MFRKIMSADTKTWVPYFQSTALKNKSESDFV